MRVLTTTLLMLVTRAAIADVVIADDLIVQSSQCVGSPCLNDYAFGFATQVLQGDTPQILFTDTSGASFPSTDWALVANDAAGGGFDRFMIKDVTNGTTPLSIFAGAPNNAFVVTNSGRIGVGQASPTMPLHITHANTPTVRLDQTNGGGFTPWIWDIGGNEVNFFIRDVSGGGRLPLRIRPGAPTSSVDITASGFVGFGTSSPQGRVHVVTAPVAPSGLQGGVVYITTNAPGDSIMLNASAQGDLYNLYTDTAGAHTWVERYGADPAVPSGRAWALAESGSPDAIAITHDGNLRIAGTLSTGSSRAIKRDIAPVDPRDVLTRVKALPVSTWRYKQDDSTHLGPMAEDFHDAFGLGEDDKHIAPSDLAGVAVAATQALANEVDQQAAELRRLEQEQKALDERLRRLEQRGRKK